MALLKPRFEFIASTAYGSLIWLMLSNLDKFILVKYLDLDMYGYYLIAVRIASVVGIMYGPISVAMRPRLTILATSFDTKTKTLDWYRKMIQILVFVMLPVGIVLGLCTEELLWAWSGNTELVANVTPHSVDLRIRLHAEKRFQPAHPTTGRFRKSSLSGLRSLDGFLDCHPHLGLVGHLLRCDRRYRLLGSV